jgi:peptidyl-prolyl cis-trans isomerase D
LPSRHFLAYDARFEDSSDMTMLDRMRRHKGLLKWSLVAVVLTFVLFYIPDFLQPTFTGTGVAPNEVLVEVGEFELTAGDYQQRYASETQAYRDQLGAAATTQLLRQLGLDQQVLAQMVDEQVALIEATRQGIVVSDDELRQQIMAIPQLQDGNGVFMGRERYEQVLLSQVPPISPAQFEEGLRRDMIVEKLRAALTDWISVTEDDLAREYRRRNERVRLQVVVLTPGEARGGVVVEDADVETYFEERRAEYRVSEQRRIRYVLLDRDQVRQDVIVPPNDIERYYNDNLALYQTPEQVHARHILVNILGGDVEAARMEAQAALERVRAGEDFAAVAREVSQDTGSAVNGGDLGFFGRGQMVAQFEEAAFALQPGEVSDLVQSQYGFHIITVEERREGVTRQLDEVRPEIQETLAAQIADQRITDQATELAGSIRTAADLDAAAQRAGVAVQESGLFQRDDPVPGLGVAPQVADAAFTLSGTEASPPIASPRGPVFITVVETLDPFVPMLEEVRDQVREDLITSRAMDAARTRAAELAPVLASAGDFAATARARGVEPQETELIARGSAIPVVGVSAVVDRVAFDLPVGGVSEPIETTSGIAIVRVAERDEVTAEELDRARETFRADLVAERRGQFYSAYMVRAREQTPIEVDSDVLRRVLAAYDQF